MNEEEYWEKFYDGLDHLDEEYLFAPTVEDNKLVIVESWDILDDKENYISSFILHTLELET
jgi:hypothetical protein